MTNNEILQEEIIQDKLQDKERLEQLELKRQNQAQKDKTSFAFSWVAIIVRGIVGSCISIFVFTQANRIEDEDTMNRFVLINEIHQNAIHNNLDHILEQTQDLGLLYKQFSWGDDAKFQQFIEQSLADQSFISQVRWNKLDQSNTITPEAQKALETNQITTEFTVPSTVEKASDGISMTYHVPISSDNKTPLGYVSFLLDLKEFILQMISPKHLGTSDLYLYDLQSEAENQLLFYFFPYDTKSIPPMRFDKLPIKDFSIMQEVYFGDHSIVFAYIATPQFTAHTWQATIAAGIGVVITSFIVITAWILLEIEKRQFTNVLHEGHILEIEDTVDLLETTKNRLVAQENLASLGGLTAGIAHEIKNPLNFINNFSTLSIDLVDDLSNFIAKYKSYGTPEERNEIYETLTTLKQNITIINEQGQRADSTIQRMLAHSRGKAGEWALMDIHKILDEYINFSFHGMRAKNSNFNVKIEKKFESTVKEVEAITNDISRVFLNLLNNAFQAVEEKERRMGTDYANPTVTIKTESLGNFIRIRIRDNGVGIDDEDKAKIFTPFFTTKPTGFGTGLGLSLSYNIIVREHGGSLTFESKKNVYTEFITTIPFRRKKEPEVKVL